MAGAMSYLVNAPNPDERTLIKSYGVNPAQAAQLLAEHLARREKPLW
jgi:hypothetical protein